MWAGITEGVTNLLSGVASVVTAIFGESGTLAALAPIMYIGIAASVIMFGYKIIRSTMWGN